MKENLIDKINQLKDLAAKSNRKVINKSDDVDLNKETALSRIIKSKEDGELYMKRLRALG